MFYFIYNQNNKYIHLAYNYFIFVYRVCLYSRLNNLLNIFNWNFIIFVVWSLNWKNKNIF
jgi:hypothetical protein